jgi:hypothetical protein
VPVNGAGNTAVCLGDGLDASTAGLIASILIPSVIGLIIWVLAFTLCLSFSCSHTSIACLRILTTKVPPGLCSSRMVCPTRVSVDNSPK